MTRVTTTGACLGWLVLAGCGGAVDAHERVTMPVEETQDASAEMTPDALFDALGAPRQVTELVGSLTQRDFAVRTEGLAWNEVVDARGEVQPRHQDGVAPGQLVVEARRLASPELGSEEHERVEYGYRPQTSWSTVAAIAYAARATRLLGDRESAEELDRSARELARRVMVGREDTSELRVVRAVALWSLGQILNEFVETEVDRETLAGHLEVLSALPQTEAGVRAAQLLRRLSLPLPAGAQALGTVDEVLETVCGRGMHELTPDLAAMFADSEHVCRLQHALSGGSDLMGPAEFLRQYAAGTFGVFEASDEDLHSAVARVVANGDGSDLTSHAGMVLGGALSSAAFRSEYLAQTSLGQARVLRSILATGADAQAFPRELLDAAMADPNGDTWSPSVALAAVRSDLEPTPAELERAIRREPLGEASRSLMLSRLATRGELQTIRELVRVLDWDEYHHVSHLDRGLQLPWTEPDTWPTRAAEMVRITRSDTFSIPTFPRAVFLERLEAVDPARARAAIANLPAEAEEALFHSCLLEGPIDTASTSSFCKERCLASLQSGGSELTAHQCVQFYADPRYVSVIAGTLRAVLAAGDDAGVDRVARLLGRAGGHSELAQEWMRLPEATREAILAMDGSAWELRQHPGTFWFDEARLAYGPEPVLWWVDAVLLESQPQPASLSIPERRELRAHRSQAVQAPPERALGTLTRPAFRASLDVPDALAEHLERSLGEDATPGDVMDAIARSGPGQLRAVIRKPERGPVAMELAFRSEPPEFTNCEMWVNGEVRATSFVHPARADSLFTSIFASVDAVGEAGDVVVSARW